MCGEAGGETRQDAASAPGTAVCAELTGAHARARTLAEVPAGSSPAPLRSLSMCASAYI